MPFAFSRRVGLGAVLAACAAVMMAAAPSVAAGTPSGAVSAANTCPQLQLAKVVQAVGGTLHRAKVQPKVHNASLGATGYYCVIITKTGARAPTLDFQIACFDSASARASYWKGVLHDLSRVKTKHRVPALGPLAWAVSAPTANEINAIIGGVDVYVTGELQPFDYTKPYLPLSESRLTAALKTGFRAVCP